MRAGPQSDELFAVAVELVTYSSVSLKRTARRFSLCGHDAEDAYQRSLERDRYLNNPNGLIGPGQLTRQRLPKEPLVTPGWI
jgi:hypothetical protein